MNARTFALIYGVVFIAVGILGFGVVPGLLEGQSGSGLQVSGMLLGKFHVNGAHNIIHILFGLWGLVASRSPGGAIGYFKAVSVIYILLAVLGLIEATSMASAMSSLATITSICTRYWAGSQPFSAFCVADMERRPGVSCRAAFHRSCTKSV